MTAKLSFDELNVKAQHIATVIAERRGICDPAELVAYAYNNAMEDVKDFIDVMIQLNPAHRSSLEALKMTMFPGLSLGPDTE